MDDVQEIFNSLLQLCDPYEFPGEWSQVHAHPDIVRLAKPASEAMELLRAKYDGQSLLGSGVAVGSHDAVDLAPGITDGSPLIALRTSPSEPPYDLLTSAGCLSGELPLFAVAKDFQTQSALVLHHYELLLSTSIQDVALLRSLGLPATLPLGLARKDGPTLLRVFEQFSPLSPIPDFVPEHARPKAAKPSEAEPEPELAVLVAELANADKDSAETDKDPAEPDLLPSLADKLVFLASRILRAEDVELDEMDQIGEFWEAAAEFWDRIMPSADICFFEPKDYERFTFCRDFGDRDKLAEAVAESVYGNDQSLSRKNRRPVIEIVDTSALAVFQRYQALEAAPNRNGRAIELARLELSAAIERELTTPLMEQALNSRDVVQGNLLVTFAQLCRCLRLKSQSAYDLLRLNTKDLEPETVLQGQREIQQVLLMSQHVVQVAKEVRRGEQSSTIDGKVL